MTLQHEFDFDPTCGYDREALLRIGPPASPPDFAEFWRDTFAATLSTPLNPALQTLDGCDPHSHLFRLDFDTLGGTRIGSWLSVPVDGEVRCGAVVGHGYGGREGPEPDLPLDGAVALFPCAPGFNLSARPDLPDNAQAHVIHDIESRERYILRSSTAMIWSAATALLAFYPQVAGRLVYLGGSFGGGLGALALPWDTRFVKAHLGVPTFGHHPLRLQCPCVGSAESVRRYYASHPEVLDVLQYYDAATAASRIGVPVLVSPALFDPAVPPPGQFAVANAIPDRGLFLLTAGHFDYPTMDSETHALRNVQERWFSDIVQ